MIRGLVAAMDMMSVRQKALPWRPGPLACREAAMTSMRRADEDHGRLSGWQESRGLDLPVRDKRGIARQPAISAARAQAARTRASPLSLILQSAGNGELPGRAVALLRYA
jgi:hypothetical protein